MPIEIASGDSAATNVAAQPANVIIYGPPGVGKTTEAVRAFAKDGRCNAFFIPCEDGALKVIPARGLPVPDHVKQPVKDWAAMVEAMAWLAQNRQHYSGVVIDGLSTWTMYVYKDLEKQHENSRNKFLIPLKVREYLFLLREWTRQIGLHCVMICHAVAPEMRDGILYRGGPLLAPKSMIEQYAGLVDSVLRLDTLNLPGREPMRVYWTGGEEWPADFGVLNQPPDWRMWRTKNREGCGLAVVPADLGAFLRARRPPYVGL